MKGFFLKGGNIDLSRWRYVFQPSRSTFPRQPPPSPPCECTNHPVLLKDLLPKEQREAIMQRRAKEFQQHKARTSSVLSKLLYALPNSPLQYPIQGYTVRPLTPTLIPGAGTRELSIESSSLVFLNELLAKLEMRRSSVSHVNLSVVFFHLSDIRSQVTILTKTFLRYPQLKVLLASIRQFYPNITVIIADDSFEPEHISGENIQQYIMPPAQGWFAGRNLAVSQVVTKYFLWVDDDFLFTQNTKIEEFVKVMEAVPELDVVGGSVEGSQFYFSILYEEGDEVEGGCLIRKSGGKFHPLPGFPKCSLADGVVNFFLARTDAVRRVGFDPQLQRVAHSEFFMDGLGLLMVATCKDVKISHQRKTEENTNPRYTEFRRPKNSDNNFKSQLHYFKNHLKCIRYS
uniref:Glycosyltransferase 2-like domain-containing protein n=1 Tax=Salarias fasciatus TaxID=181472 RepID=A0A672IAC0_SALFA